MLPSVYGSPLKLHLDTKINLHGVSGSSFLKFKAIIDLPDIF